MSTIQTTNPNTSESIPQPKSTLNLRIAGADNAPGFAQVLQAFDREESAITQQTQKPEDSASQDQSATQTDDSGVDEQSDRSASTDDSQDESQSSSESTDQSVTATDQADQDPDSIDNQNRSQDQSTNQDQRPDTQQSDQAQQTAHSSSEQSTQSQAAQQNVGSTSSADAQPNQNQVQQESVGFDLLSNKSDQAKLSIRGLVRAIRADASQDTTTIAVQTRLGERPATPTAQTQQADAANVRQPEPPPSVLRPPAIDDPTRNPADALSTQAPTSPRSKDQTLQSPNLPIDLARPVSEQPSSQTRADVQHARATRVDAAVGGQQLKPSVDVARPQPLHTLLHSDGAARADGALTARAVTAIDAAGQRSGIESTTQRADAAPKLAQQSANELQSKVVAQVQRGLASLMQSKSGEMTLRLTPERLGELKIEIKRDGDRMAIRLSTQSAEARELLNSGTDELANSLRSKGIDLERVYVEQESADGNAPDEHQQNQDRSDDQRDHQAQHAPSGAIADAGVQDINEPTDIWTELGLDAIA